MQAVSERDMKQEILSLGVAINTQQCYSAAVLSRKTIFNCCIRPKYSQCEGKRKPKIIQVCNVVPWETIQVWMIQCQ